MSIKCHTDHDKKMNPLIGFVLLFLALVLFILTVPLGLLFSCCYRLITRSIHGIGEYFLQIAISIDQLGNVIMADLLNAILLTKSGYKFGNRDETISSVLGKNLSMNTLTYFGKKLTQLIDFVDAGHSLNSIDYFVQPDKDPFK